MLLRLRHNISSGRKQCEGRNIINKQKTKKYYIDINNIKWNCQQTVVSPQSEYPNSEQFLKVTGFRGDGRAVIPNVTHKANIVGQIWRSRDFCSGSIKLYKETMQLGSNCMSDYSIYSPGILRENIMYGIWVFESSKNTIVRFKNHRPKSDRCPYTEQNPQSDGFARRRRGFALWTHNCICIFLILFLLFNDNNNNT
jgi:hypothetical protein